jgi:hypothetical protein
MCIPLWGSSFSKQHLFMNKNNIIIINYKHIRRLDQILKRNTKFSIFCLMIGTYVLGWIFFSIGHRTNFFASRPSLWGVGCMDEKNSRARLKICYFFYRVFRSQVLQNYFRVFLFALSFEIMQDICRRPVIGHRYICSGPKKPQIISIGRRNNIFANYPSLCGGGYMRY